MLKSKLKIEDEVAVRDPSCTNNVHKGIITCLTDSKQGVWVAVNYRYGLLPNTCARNEDRWVLVKTTGKSIVGYWSKYQKIVDDQVQQRAETVLQTEALQQRTSTIKTVLHELGISSRAVLGSVTVSVEDMERLIAAHA